VKCSHCLKVIPDGFTDCPWCGAVYPAPTLMSSSVPPPVPTRGAALVAPAHVSASGPNDALFWIASLLSFLLVVFLTCTGLGRKLGPINLANSAPFIGAILGTYIFPILGVWVYYRVRKLNPPATKQVFAVSMCASALALSGFINSASHFSGPSDPALARHVSEIIKNPSATPSATPPTKWDPAIRAFFADLRAFNEGYVSEVSKLDAASFPLYSPESFRDSATIQQMLSQLQDRAAVAARYASLDPVLAKMPTYVQALDATDFEKKEFLQGFQSSSSKAFGHNKIVANLEHDWLAASIALYQFALSYQGAYSLREGNLFFKSNATASEFNRKLQNAQRLRVEFLQAYSALRNQQNAALAQLGLQPSDLGLSTGH
jgi:hypothetical protein